MSEDKQIILMPTFWKSFKDVIHPSVWRRIRNFWYDFKWSIKNQIKFRKIISEFRPWDYSIILKMLNFQLKQLCEQIEYRGMEENRSRLQKVKRMKRAIELLNNIEEDNYAERCGYNSKAQTIKFVKISDKKSKELKLDQDLYEMTFNINKGYENYDSLKIFREANELETKEFEELFEILKTDMRGWWD